MTLRRLEEDLKIESSKIPKNFKGLTNEEKKSVITKTIKKDFSIGKNTLNYNFYQSLKKYGFEINFNLEGNQVSMILDSKVEIKIKKQNYFHFIFVDRLKTLSKKNSMLKEYFYEDGFMKNSIKVEDEVFIKRKDKYFVDFTIKVKDYYLCVEFFEKKTHYDKDDPEYKIDKMRALQILDDDKYIGKKCCWFGIFWDYDLTDKKKCFKFVNETVKRIEDYYYINDERHWCLHNMNKYISNNSFCELLYDSYQNKNELIIEYQDLVNCLLSNILKKEYHEKLLDDLRNYVNDLRLIEDKDDIEENDLFDEAEEFDNEEQTEITYYIKDKISYNGLHCIMHLINPTMCVNLKAFNKIIMLYQNITTGYLDGLKDQFEKLKSLSDNRIYGL